MKWIQVCSGQNTSSRCAPSYRMLIGYWRSDSLLSALCAMIGAILSSWAPTLQMTTLIL